MTDRFYVSEPLYPLLSVLTSLLTFIGALVTAETVYGIVFLVGVYLLLCAFGYLKSCVKILPFFAVYLSLLSAIFYFASSGDAKFTLQMAVRLGGVVIAVIPGLSLPPVSLMRNLTQLNCHRYITLGMLITLSFIPVLTAEINQVRGAMKTRGAANILKPQIFYRAFLIPLTVRLVNISDTLALSVETRAFISEKADYTVYKPVSLKTRDVIFSVIFFALFILGIFFAVLEVGA